MTPIDHSLHDETVLKLAFHLVAPGDQDIRRSTALDALDMSHFEFMAFVAALEDLCHADLPDSEIARCATLGDVVDVMRARRSSRRKAADRVAGESAGGRRQSAYPRHRPACVALFEIEAAAHRQAS